MPITITMPKLSPTMEEGMIVKWHKKVGDKVEAGALLLEVATDKATVEYNALDEFFLREILVAEGKSAVINQPIAIGTATANEPYEVPKPEGAKPAMPTQKTDAPKAPAAPAPTAPVPQFAPEPPLQGYKFSFPTGEGRTAASPLAKKIAKEKGIDLTTVKGTGPGGRVTSDDLNLAQPDLPVTFGRRELPTDVPGSYEEIALTPMRKAVGQRLQQSKSSIPHFYITQEIDAEPMIALREQLKEGGLKVTYNDFVLRACAVALRQHPEVNSGFDSTKQSIIQFKTVDISVAVSIEGGLITPIVRHADYKNIGELSAEVKALAARAKEGKLEPHEYKGGSFTISNLGMYGVSEFIAVINPPQAAILAIAGIEPCARIRGKEVVAGQRMNITLSADHRVVDGSDGAKFLQTVKKFLENPALLLV